MIASWRRSGREILATTRRYERTTNASSVGNSNLSRNSRAARRATRFGKPKSVWRGSRSGVWGVSVVIGARKIGASKVAEQFDGLAVVGSRCVNRIIKISSMVFLPINEKLSPPSIVPNHTFISRRIVFSLLAVPTILGNCGWTQIALHVIQSIAVCMVIYLSIVHDLVLHGDHTSWRSIFDLAVAAGIVGMCVLIPSRHPIISANSLVLRGINSGRFTFCEGNEFDRLIERLLNRVTFHSGLHSLSVKEIVQQRAALISDFTMIGGS